MLASKHFFNVMEHQAVADGKTKNTAIIQKLIDQCAVAGGGTVYFPAGTYLSGTIYLKDNVTLELSTGATILGSPDKEDYNADDFCPQNLVFARENVSGAHLIVAVEVNNCSIRGGGKIDGTRAAFYNKPREDYPQKFALTDWRPGQMLYFCESTNITIENVELNNAAYWTCFLHGCENVQIDNVKIWNAFETPNGDGIDIDCCKNVTVSNCIIVSGDDSITFRGNPNGLKNPRPCENVVVTNCILSTPCNAFRVGVGSGEIKNCTVSNCMIYNTRTGICIVSKYGLKSAGVKIENINFSNIIMDVVRPIFLAANVRGSINEESKLISGIFFNNLSGKATRSSLIEGNDDQRLERVTISGYNFIYSGDGEDIEYGEDLRYAEFSVKAAPAAFHVRNVKDIEFDRVAIDWQTDSAKWLYGIWTQNCRELYINRCRMKKDYKINQKILTDKDFK